MQIFGQTDRLIASFIVQQRSPLPLGTINDACILRSFAKQGKQGDGPTKLWSGRTKCSNPK
ncbi:MAG: hypothetical protein CMM07_28920 [Rhodopirellula sp.]|nr:hypothetical protein [Rhodopirellula sp.]